MSCCKLVHPQTVRRNSSDSITINFLIPKLEAPPTLSQEHFRPERILSWTARLSIQLSRQLNFNLAIQTASWRLGLSDDCDFYFNCLPEHEKISGLKALNVIPINTPAQEDLPPGVQIYIFVSSKQSSIKSSTASSQSDDDDDDDEADNAG